MQNPTRINPKIKDPSISDFPMTDDPTKPKQEDIIAASSVAEDKSMPSQSGGSMNPRDTADVDVSDLKKNNIKEYGGKPKGDQAIPNRGVTHPNPSKDKAV
jgi:hypothetical protein